MIAVETVKALHKALAKALKSRAYATSVTVNYQGTGNQAHRRQLWVRFENGEAVDIFLTGAFTGAMHLRIGGVITRHAELNCIAEHSSVENAVEFVVAKLGAFGAKATT